MKVLIAGESWVTNSVHIKGFDQFTTSVYEEGVKWLQEALEKAHIEVDFMPNHLAPVCFPGSLPQLQGYDAVILSDIGSNTLLIHPETFFKSKITGNRLKALKEYVASGKGFAMIGGYMSFQGIDAKARYKNTEIEEILPVQMMPYDDRIEAPQGIVVEILQPKHPIFSGVDEKWPLFLGYNQLKAKDEKAVLARCGQDIFMAAWEYQKGRTFAFASDCSPHWGPPEFVNWKCYGTFWVNVVKWLTKEI
jgi:uncharacterized membrane protein